MNTLNRPLFRQMGGPAEPMPQDMPMAMPPPQEAIMAVQQAENMGTQMGQEYLAQTMGALDNAETSKEVIDAIRGNNLPIEARYDELANFVGQEDAQQTPESVLALVQPTIMMTEEGAMNSGIGQLMQSLVADTDMAPNTDMTGGVGSLMMAGASEAPAPQNFNQGGAVAYLENGSDDSGTVPAGIASINAVMETFGSLAKPPSVDTVKGYYESLLPMYREILGQTEEDERMRRGETFFDIAQAGLNLAAGIDPRTGRSTAGMPFVSQLAAAASPLPGQISARAAKQRAEDRVLNATALQQAMQQAQGEQGFKQAVGTALAKDLFGTSRAYSPFTLYRPDGSDFTTINKNDPNFETELSKQKGLGFTSTSDPTGSSDKGYSPFTLYKPDGSDFTTINKNDPNFETKVAEKKELGFTSTSDPAGDDDEAYSVFTLYKPDGSDFTTIDRNDPNFETKVAEQKELGFTTPDKPTGEGDASPFNLFNAEGENIQIDKNLGSAEFERRVDEAKGLGFTLLESPDLSLFGSRAVGKARARSTEEGFEEKLYQHIFLGNKTAETRVAVDDLLLLLQPVEGSTTPGQVRPELQIFAAMIQPGAENLLAEVQQAVAINPTGTQAAVSDMQQTLAKAKNIATDIMLGNNKTDDLANDIELLISDLAVIDLKEATGLPSLVTNVAETVAQQFADVMNAPIQSKITSDTKEARRLLETYQTMAEQFFFQAPEQDRPLAAQYDNLMRRFPEPRAGELDSDAMQRVRNLGAMFRNNENYYRDVLRNPNIVATGRTLDSSRKRLRQAQMLAKLSEAMVQNYESGPSGSEILNQPAVGNLSQRMLQYTQ